MVSHLGYPAVLAAKILVANLLASSAVHAQPDPSHQPVSAGALVSQALATSISKELAEYKQAFTQCNRAAFLKNSVTFAVGIASSPESKSKVTFAKRLDAYEKVAQRLCSQLDRSLEFREIKVIYLNTTTYLAAVVAERNSSLFSSRSLDVLRFVDRPGASPLLVSHVITPVRQLPTARDPATLIIVPSAVYNGAVSRLDDYLLDDADTWLGALKAASVSTVRSNSPSHTVIAVLRDPIFLGDRLLLTHRYFNSSGRQTSQFSQGVNADATHLHFFLASSTTITQPGSARFELYKNGKLLKARTIATP